VHQKRNSMVICRPIASCRSYTCAFALLNEEL
jgi:hypothetical protein